MKTYYLSLEEILILHFQLIEDFGGSHGVRDESSLKSVEQAPKQILYGREQYPTVYDKAAVYLRNIIGDHPFSDGNKRTGITVAGVFLFRNGTSLTATPKELEDFAVRVAVDKLDVPAISAWIESHTR
ncbi:type II toxin-antitoxin system death-on-curing family toxin [Candidatus Saccharibacteria bacterium]|nr:type II toxin-antitoxin system death-on-curing family toxin [Candidatus Saccharibacteria bacterium]